MMMKIKNKIRIIYNYLVKLIMHNIKQYYKDYNIFILFSWIIC